MPRTADSLVYSCMSNLSELSLPVLVDYFGRATTDEEIAIVLQVYRELIVEKGVDATLLHNCFLSNRLNEVVHAKNEYRPSNAYKVFREQNIDLTTITCLDPIDECEWLSIQNDNCCPNCGVGGFHTDDSKYDKLCTSCSRQMCCYCVEEDDICTTCYAG